MMLSERAPPPMDLDDDDSLSSDDSFMPPVLSNYAKQLLSEDGQKLPAHPQENTVTREELPNSKSTINNTQTRTNERLMFTRRPRGSSSLSAKREREREGEGEAEHERESTATSNTMRNPVTNTVTGTHGYSGLGSATKNTATNGGSTRSGGVFARNSFKRTGLDYLKRSSYSAVHIPGAAPQLSHNADISSGLGSSLVALSASESKENASAASHKDRDSPSSPSQWRPSKYMFTESRGTEVVPKRMEPGSTGFGSAATTGTSTVTSNSTILHTATNATDLGTTTPTAAKHKPFSRVSNSSLNAMDFSSQTETWKKSAYSNLHSGTHDQYKTAQKENRDPNPLNSGTLVKTPVTSVAPEFVPGKKDSNERPKKKPKNLLAINGIQYQRLELVGKGGSSKVYKVQTTGGNNPKVYAVKKVTFDDVDLSVIEGFKGEISLLQRLKDNDRVVRLVDYEMFDMSVYLVMECGEIDFAHVLSARLNMPLDISFVRYYAQEMIKCVAAVHEHGIVHSDLKPANFLLVKGMLKIIDFGIANVVPDYTSNIHRDMQMGTPSYMAPEALLAANGDVGAAYDPSQVKFKVGKPSDVWSCGCIIYQMIYGKAPYSSYQGAQRVLAITNPKVQVQYPREGLGNVKVPHEAIETIKGCLIRDPNERMTVQDVLRGTFLNPLAVDKNFIKSLIQNAIEYGSERGRGAVSPNEMDQLTSDVWDKLIMMNR